MGERILSRDKEGVENKSEAYPLRYVEDLFSMPDAGAGQKAPSMRVHWRRS